MIECTFCRGFVKKGNSNFMTDTDEDHFIIVKHVPSQICSQCGEVFYDMETTKKLESIINTTKENINDEVVILNYEDEAA